MVSDILRTLPVRESTEFDMIQAIYESECEAVQIVQGMVVMEHIYHVTGDPEILMEGFGDVLHSIGEWFKKVIKAIKDFFARTIGAFLDSSASLDAFVNKYKDILLNSTVDETIDGFNFTVLGSPKPDMSPFDQLVNSYNEILSDLGSRNTDTIKNDSMIFLKRENLAKVRAQVLGTKGGYEQEGFLKEVRAYYRDGKEDSQTIHINSDYIKEIVNHASDLVKAKDAAAVDRDRIIKLLNRAEAFFSNKALISYTDGNAKIKTSKITSTSSSKVFNAESGERIDYESNYKKFSALINSKYNETKTLTNIINIVITERMNALLDQVKQEKKAVMKAVKKGSSKEDVSEAFDYEEFGSDDEQTNYIAIESEMNLDNGPVLEEITLRNLCRESMWYDQVMEGNYDVEVVMEGFIGNVIKALQELISKIIGMFKTKAKENTPKYKEWFNDEGVLDTLKENAKNKRFKMKDVWSANYQQQLTMISNAFNTALQPTKDYSNCPFAKEFLGESNIEKINAFKDNNRNIDNVIQNFFRNGKAGVDNIDEYTLAGTELSSKVQQMVDYIANFDKFSQTLNDLDAKAKNLKVPEGVAESTRFGFDSFLEIEGRPVIETDLAVLLQDAPDWVLEQTGDAGAKPAQGQAQNAQNAAPKPDDPTKTQKNNVQDVSDQNANNSNQENGKGNNDAEKKYFAFNVNLLKKLVANYLTIQEERRKNYIDILLGCADDKHKFVLHDGKYVKIKDRGSANSVKDLSKKEQANAKEAAKNAKRAKKEEAAESTNVYDKSTQGVDWMM